MGKVKYEKNSFGSTFSFSHNTKRFIGLIESTFRSWNKNSTEREVHVQLNYADKYYFMKLHEKSVEESKKEVGESYYPPPLKEMLDTSSDFPTKTHYLARWFGFDKFIILTSLDSEGTNIGEAHMLLSSLQIASNNCEMHYPMIVQIGRPEHGVHIGSVQCPGTVTTLSSDMLENYRAKLKEPTITKLMELFHRKLVHLSPSFFLILQQ